MSENKTQPTDADVLAFLSAVEHPGKRADALALHQMMQEISGEPGRMWGSSIVGYGQYHYRYDSGREGDFMRVGFSPRKANISLYIMPGFEIAGELMGKLGKHKTGKSCLTIHKLADVDASVLRQLIRLSLDEMARRYPEGA
ncbi:MAG: DUF1801 domain-containing protein [Alphaproteobacteria bacterium]|nr:DUF1801 domain-containing protein [Alphaproteobacteria bacterium]